MPDSKGPRPACDGTRAGNMHNEDARYDTAGPSSSATRLPLRDLLSSARWFFGPEDAIVAQFQGGQIEVWLTGRFAGAVDDRLYERTERIETLEAEWDDGLARLDIAFRSGRR